MSIEDGGTAFPTPDECEENPGMYLRDYMAIAIAQGAIACPVTQSSYRYIILSAYKYADEMLRVRTLTKEEVEEELREELNRVAI